jgi:hypothetical protein
VRFELRFREILEAAGSRVRVPVAKDIFEEAFQKTHDDRSCWLPTVAELSRAARSNQVAAETFPAGRLPGIAHQFRQTV